MNIDRSPPFFQFEQSDLYISDNRCIRCCFCCLSISHSISFDLSLSSLLPFCHFPLLPPPPSVSVSLSPPGVGSSNVIKVGASVAQDWESNLIILPGITNRREGWRKRRKTNKRAGKWRYWLHSSTPSLSFHLFFSLSFHLCSLSLSHPISSSLCLILSSSLSFINTSTQFWTLFSLKTFYTAVLKHERHYIKSCLLFQRRLPNSRSMSK